MIVAFIWMSSTVSNTVLAQVQAPQANRAEMIVAGRTIFVFRAMLTGYSPAERAEAASRRLERALASGGPIVTGVRTIPEGTQVLLGNSLLFLVTQDDINSLAGDTTAVVGTESARLLAQALTERRDQMSLRYLGIAAATSVAATLIYAASLYGLGLMRSWGARRSEELLNRKLQALSFQNVRLLEAEHYLGLAGKFTRGSIWILQLLATYLWLTFLLSQFPYSRRWGEWLRDHLIATAAGIVEATAAAVPGVLIVTVIIIVARVLALTTTSIFKRIENGELQLGGLDRDTAMPTRRLTSLVIWLFALAMAYPYLPGSHTAAFQGLTVLAGLMVSIGASSIVAQAASGLILMYTRPLRKGEYVQIGDAEGAVVELGMFATRVRTGYGEEISMPNNYVLSNMTRNFSRAAPGAGFVIHTSVTIGYDTPWRQVHALLDTAARHTEGVAAMPPPHVGQTALSDFYIEYRLTAYADVATAPGRAELMNRLHQNILDEFNRYGVQIMSPHFEQQPQAACVVAPNQWHSPPANAGR